MKAKFFQDDHGNHSSFRVIWVVFMAVVVVALIAIIGLLIWELGVGGEDVNEWISGLEITGGVGIGGFILATVRKWIEGLRKPIEPTSEPKEESEYIAPPEPLSSPVASCASPFVPLTSDMTFTVTGTITYKPKNENE